MKKEDLKLVCTCDSCPEQYDVFAEGYSYPVGYIRFRSGWFTCQALDKTGNTPFRPIIVAWEDWEGKNEIPAIVKDDLLDICKDAICQYFTTEERLNLVDEKYKNIYQQGEYMEAEFNSQICTTVEQSDRLLSLGLKPETADMHFLWGGYWHPVLEDWAHAVGDYPFDFDGEEEQGEWELRHHPAWSLHRLLCLYGLEYTIMEVFNKDGETYDNLISLIEEAIKEGYFNKEYLV